MALLGLPQVASYLPQLQQPAQQPADPFVWGEGGMALTPDELAQRRMIAQSLMQSDYSPVQNVWQGLGRVADNWIGALDARDMDRQAEMSAQRSNTIAEALMRGGGGDLAARAMTDPYASPEVQGLGKMMWERANPKEQGPAELQRNHEYLLSLGQAELADQYLQNRANPIQGVPFTNEDGSAGIQFIRPGTVNPVQPLPTAPVGKLTPIPGGPTPPASGGFHIPSGNPLEPPRR
jgi:hypothetical protein